MTVTTAGRNAVQNLKIVVLAILLNGLAYSNASAATGNELNGYCEGLNGGDDVPRDQSAVSSVKCTYYVEGVIDADVLGGRDVCFSEDFTYRQAALIVKKYLEDHPEKLHLRASILVKEALKKALSCP